MYWSLSIITKYNDLSDPAVIQMIKITKSKGQINPLFKNYDFSIWNQFFKGYKNKLKIEGEGSATCWP